MNALEEMVVTMGVFFYWLLVLFFQVVLLVLQIWNHVTPHLLSWMDRMTKNTRMMMVIASLLFVVPTTKTETK